MKYIKVGAATLNQTPLDWIGNQKNILAAIETARIQKVSILCLPELCISGYGCEDAFLSPNTLIESQRMLQRILPYTKEMVVAVGLPINYQNRVYNAVCLLANEQICGFVAKRFLAGDGIHYEPRWFKPWVSNAYVEIEISGKRYPLGDIYFNCGGVRIGFEICEEAWVANRPGIRLAQKGVDIILNPSASHFAFDKRLVRERFVLEGSRAFSVSYVYANLLGNEAGRAIYDGDCLIATGGQLLATGKRFSFANYQVVSALVDVDLTRMSQARTGDSVPNLDTRVYIPFDYPDCLPIQPSHSNQPSWEFSPTLKEEEFTRAVSLGLFDYLRKSRSHGFVISLSGGADSSAIACLVRLMVALGLEELGTQGFCDKLSYIKTLPQTTIGDMVKQLLTCVYQSTENSTKTTQQAATTLAQALGADYLELNINKLVKAYVDIVSSATNVKLTWEKDDLALQNIQARTRAPSVWLIANLRNALLLATSNRSEVALGYATMDGDTAGGLSPLAGIDKDFLRHWLRWLEQEGSMNLGTIPALSLINQQAPTAELRPTTHGKQQTDEDDLMPYNLLNVIEKAAIRDRQTPHEIYHLLHARFPDYQEAQLLTWIERFFSLWSRNQWKRERYAPSFHLDDENLDPRSWCRFPILSGGYQLELAEMKTRLQKK
ncbi:NAD(+) synthase [Beggiatoa leptomitoformis]|uniref:Glutamine-dependent NAD(+) synthetase n=1 Tax=Beggiatoa leptomitoformis TaxID=288004 RepID=A0A2N9YAR2_9GAMM|nr:NAD(+) synthase [Beggiatoa leptomitoformis]ALG67067.1 NAD(+) synthase [Beggiatoa leptomitoformis]AUI67545.1 NAD(+) synthase [Beggiatoa leptomitoformis]